MTRSITSMQTALLSRHNGPLEQKFPEIIVGSIQGGTAMQDGFDLDLHGFFVTEEGKWTVVQKGLNGDKKQARRYHWHSEDLKSFVDEPHSAIDGPAQGEVVNLTDKRAETSRIAQLELLTGLGPHRIVSELSFLSREVPAQGRKRE